MEVKSAMLASSLNLTPTLSASATALFPASSARIAAPALSMEGTSATARSPWKARPPPRIVAPSLSTPVTAHSLWKIFLADRCRGISTVYWVLGFYMTRQFALPSIAQRHILAGLASAVGGLSAPYERASRIHERHVVKWLWAAGCHPFGTFLNSSQISQILQDVALRTTIYAQVDAALRKIRDTSGHLKTPLGELVKGNKNKSTIELWVEKFYKKVTNLPEPFPHDLVEKLEEYLDKLEGQLVDLSSLLYDHRLVDAYQNSTDILQSTIFTQQYVERVLANERDKMKCCSIEYSHPKQSSQAFVYGGILLAGFLVYSLVIFFSSPVR
ncbi:hypothetical protein ZEAMMB73_Zm00001d019451 [Zea mays]|uniref:Uncharacterized protein n=1 Tax=Zea mays TaxID=4577 RepID=A0A1D6HXI5_MAIZE|nr:hypothetical protein ZEAMMB73_Zm00001d019451 [Zea mays]